MKTLAGKFGICYLCDNMDPKHGLPSLDTKSWDLCFTDTIWGHDYDGKKPFGINKKAKKRDVQTYNDAWVPDYHLTWMKEIQRITNAQVVCVGRKHYDWWIINFQETHQWDIDIVYPNGQGSTKTSKHGARMPYLCFGTDWWKQNKFWKDVYQTYISNGFLRTESFYNPSPKDVDLWASMLSDLDPKSVIDPFGGSGTLAEACEILGIPWLMYEQNIDIDGNPAKYHLDIQKRIKRGMKKHSQQSLKQFIK